MDVYKHGATSPSADALMPALQRQDESAALADQQPIYRQERENAQRRVPSLLTSQRHVCKYVPGSAAATCRSGALDGRSAGRERASAKYFFPSLLLFDMCCKGEEGKLCVQVDMYFRSS